MYSFKKSEGVTQNPPTGGGIPTRNIGIGISIIITASEGVTEIAKQKSICLSQFKRNASALMRAAELAISILTTAVPSSTQATQPVFSPIYMHMWR